MQRARLTAALVQVVAEHGAQGLSVARIVSRAGVSRRTFYELFDGCEDCLVAGFEDCFQRTAARVLPAYESERRWRDRVRAGLVEMLQAFDEEHGLARVLVVESLAAGPRLLGRRAHALEPVIAAIDAGRGEARPGSIPTPLTAEGVVGAVGAILHARLCAGDRTPLVRLAGPLMSTIALPYLGPAVARAELRRPVRHERRAPAEPEFDGDLMKEIGMRLTYRTARVLMAVSERPGANNRQLAHQAGILDQGQISKLLRRLQRLGLLDNANTGSERGAANAWRLTERGQAVMRVFGRASSP
jgi:AcrR family transcriptional regulator